jgi:alpha-glucosidase
LYYGDELGIGNVSIPANAVRDPWERSEPGLGLGRDPQRTPMQWDASQSGGFSDATPWLPVASDHAQVNVASQRNDPGSMLTLYRRLIGLRRACPPLTQGAFRMLSAQDNVLAYERSHRDHRLLMALNFDSAPKKLIIPVGANERVLLSTKGDPSPAAPLVLRPDEGVIVGDPVAAGHA